MNYFSMFSGIGGFEYGINQACNHTEIARIQPGRHTQDKPSGNEQCLAAESFPCVGYSEINKYAAAIYRYHYPKHKNYGDATTIDVSRLPNFNLLVGGFPCQSFSIAGKRQGFKDTRGTLFFDVARVLKAKRPAWFLLENVKGLCSHESGKTLARIYRILVDLGYTVAWQVVNSCQFGVPQSRERIFIVGHLATAGGRAGEVLPVGIQPKKTIDGYVINRFANLSNKGQSQKGQVYDDDGISPALSAGTHGYINGYFKVGTWRTHKDGRGFREVESGLAPAIPARAREDGSGQPVIKVPPFIPSPKDVNNCLRTGGDSTLSPKHNYDHIYDGYKIRRLTPVECERLQSFPDNWTKFGIIDGRKVEISDTQRYKALGNAVTTSVVAAFIKRITAVA